MQSPCRVAPPRFAHSALPPTLSSPPLPPVWSADGATTHFPQEKNLRNKKSRERQEQAIKQGEERKANTPPVLPKIPAAGEEGGGTAAANESEQKHKHKHKHRHKGAAEQEKEEEAPAASAESTEAAYIWFRCVNCGKLTFHTLQLPVGSALVLPPVPPNHVSLRLTAPHPLVRLTRPTDRPTDHSLLPAGSTLTGRAESRRGRWRGCLRVREWLGLGCVVVGRGLLSTPRHTQKPPSTHTP